MPVQTFIADDHEIVLDGLRLILETTGIYSVVGTATNGRDAVDGILRTRPQLTIIDMIMPGMNGTEIAREVRAHLSATKILILSMTADIRIVQQALAAGANGYMLKESTSRELLEALSLVLADRRYLSPTLYEAILDAHIHGLEGVAQSPVAQLSPREREIVAFVVEGHTSAEIGRRLGLAASTIDTYRSRIMAKLQVDSAAALIRMAIVHEIVNSPDPVAKSKWRRPAADSR